MLHKMKYLLASAALVACMSHAAPYFSNTTVQESVTESPHSTTTTEKTVTTDGQGSVSTDNR